MCKVYGYARISRKQQNIERQIRNIRDAYKDAIIYQEAYTGTKMLGRKEFDKLSKVVRPGDTIVFDSVSRMSRNAEEGFKQYMKWYNDGINLVFLKESTINTDSFKFVLGNEQLSFEVKTNDEDMNEFLNGIMKHVSVYITKLAQKQIRLAFEQAQKEVDDLHQRTKEGIQTARLHGKQIGAVQGKKLTTKKSMTAKEQMKKRCRMFGGDLKDEDAIKIIGISKPTFYKYKKELMLELMQQEEE